MCITGNELPNKVTTRPQGDLKMVIVGLVTYKY